MYIDYGSFKDTSVSDDHSTALSQASQLSSTSAGKT